MSICHVVCGDLQTAYNLSWQFLCFQMMCGGCAVCNISSPVAPPSPRRHAAVSSSMNDPVYGAGIEWSTLCDPAWSSNTAGVGLSRLRRLSCPHRLPPETCSGFCASMNDPVYGAGIEWSTLCDPAWSSEHGGGGWVCHGCDDCQRSATAGDPPHRLMFRLLC